MNNIPESSVPMSWKINQKTVSWLMSNFEAREDMESSIPRFTMYYFYYRHCQLESIEPINAASYGKLLKSVFPHVKTRRLGHRGQSKYHYYGIKLRINSDLVIYSKTDGNNVDLGTNQEYHSQVVSNDISGLETIPLQPQEAYSNVETYSQISDSLSQHWQEIYLQEVQVSLQTGLTKFPILEVQEIISSESGFFSEQVLFEFEYFYRRHCEALFELICSFNFNSVKSVWFNFWRGPDIDCTRDNIFCPPVLQPPIIVETISSMKKLYRSASIFLNQDNETDQNQHEDLNLASENQKEKNPDCKNGAIQSINHFLPNIDQNTSLNQSNLYKDNILHRLCSFDTILAWSRKCDQILYQSIISTLIPDVLRPIPTSITQELRQFAKSLDILLLESIYDYPIKFLNSKLATILSFSQILRRYTSLNHLAHAARTVLQNPRNTLEMYNDIQKVNFFSIQEQASWICQCDVSLISKLELEFKSTLVKRPSLENWGTWLENVVSNCLQSANSSEDLIEYSRQFLLKWSFYSSMIIRDLTLRSSSSFGSFHLIRLLFDEYTFYLIEQKIARGTNRLPIDVTSEFACFSPKEFNSAMNIPSSHSFSVYSLQDKFQKHVPNEQSHSHLDSKSVSKDVLK